MRQEALCETSRLAEKESDARGAVSQPPRKRDTPHEARPCNELQSVVSSIKALAVLGRSDPCCPVLL